MQGGGVYKWFLPKPLGKNIKDKKEKKIKKVVPKLFWRQVAEPKLKYSSLRVTNHPPSNAPYDAGTVRQQNQRAKLYFPEQKNR